MSGDKILEKKIGEKVPVAAPSVSVVIPAYNVCEFIADTLDGVLAQTFSEYEIILVNDGSPDTAELEKVLEKYFPYLVYIKQQNGGTASARNTAIAAARGSLLAFLDGDDIWYPEYLESQVAALRNNECDLIYTDALLFGSVADKTENYMRRSPSNGAVTPESLIDGSCNVITSGTLARREKITGCGAFDEDLPRIGMEDYDLWFRLAKTGARLDYRRRVLLKYRVRQDSLSGSNVQRAERSLTGLEILQRKYSLSESETAVIERSKAEAQAELELERGKYHLGQGDFQAAHTAFRRANRHYRKIRLGIVVWSLKLHPKFVVKLLKKMRPGEFPPVASPDAENNSSAEPPGAAANYGN